MTKLDRALLARDIVESSEVISIKEMEGYKKEEAYIVGSPQFYLEDSKSYTCVKCKEKIYCDKNNSKLIDKKLAQPICVMCCATLAMDRPGEARLSVLKENKESLNKIVGKAVDDALGEELK